MIVPNQIRRGVIVITVDNEKFIVDDYDDGTNNPVGHFAVHCVKHEGDMNGKWIGSEKIKSVKRTNIKEPVRATDMAISQWQNFGPKTLPENKMKTFKQLLKESAKNPRVFKIEFTTNGEKLTKWVYADYIDNAIEKLKKKYNDAVISRYSFDQEKQNKSDADIK